MNRRRFLMDRIQHLFICLLSAFENIAQILVDLLNHKAEGAISSILSSFDVKTISSNECRSDKHSLNKVFVNGCEFGFF